MDNKSVSEQTYKMKFLQMCDQRERELRIIEVALLSARKKLKPSDALDNVNGALAVVFDL